MVVGACGRCMECARRAQLDEWMSALQEMANAYGLREVSWTGMVVRHLLCICCWSYGNLLTTFGLAFVVHMRMRELIYHWLISVLSIVLCIACFCGLIAPSICMFDLIARKEFFRAAATSPRPQVSFCSTE